MKLFKNRLYAILILFLFSITPIKSKEVKIFYKINEKIITNIDVENEARYLVALNKNLKSVPKNDLFKYAKESIFREMIKKIEIDKVFLPDQKDNNLSISIENIYKILEINSESDFKRYLKEHNLSLKIVKNKIKIESMWNQLIYMNYKNKLNINEEKLKKNIIENSKKKKIEKLLLSEIVYSFNNKEEINSIYNQIIKDINEVGFERVVVKYSISTTRNNSGDLGWINSNNLSKKIKQQLINLKIDEITKPIMIPGGVLLLKIRDKKIANEEIDINNELKKLVAFEINNQLNNYSIMYFNEVKNKLIIHEY
jgi:peptidyl-prolyl cis-trans isomerase SurA